MKKINLKLVSINGVPIVAEATGFLGTQTVIQIHSPIDASLKVVTAELEDSEVIYSFPKLIRCDHEFLGDSWVADYDASTNTLMKISAIES